MQYSSSIETDLKILTALAREKEFEQYKMPELLNKTYRTVLRHIKELEENDLIKVTRLEVSQKGGKDKKIYTLTAMGLMKILGTKNIYNYIDEIAMNYASVFPLIFGKWNFFIEKGIRNEMIARLQSAVLAFFMQHGKEWYRIVAGMPQEKIKVLIEKKGKERAERNLWSYKQVVGNLTNSVLGFNLYLHSKDETERIKEEIYVLRILMEDPEIREYIHKEIVFWEEQKKQIYENVHAWREWFESLD